MKKIYTLTLLLALASFCQAQVTFQKTYGTAQGSRIAPGDIITTTSDGGFALAGVTPDLGAGGYDFYIMRTDNLGHQLWTKTFGSPYDDVPESIEQTTDHGFIITGSMLRVSGSEVHSDLVLIKTDSIGDTLWTKMYGEDMTDEIGWYVRQTFDGGYIAVGNWGSSSHTYIVKTNNVGDTLWTRVLDAGTANSVRQLPDSGYIISGGTYSFNTNGQDFFLMRLNKGGNVMWAKDLGLVGTEYQSIVHIDNVDSTGYILAGTNIGYGVSERYKAYIIKTDTLGNPVWSRTYGDNQYGVYGVEALPTNDGYALMCITSPIGSYNYPRLVKINRSGQVQWSKHYSYLGAPRVLEQTADKGYVFSTGYGIFNITKTDSLGNSGCQQSDTLTTDSVVTTLVYNMTVNSQTGTIINNPHLSISSGGTETTLCINAGVTGPTTLPVGISVYPNPASDELIVTSNMRLGIIATIKIYTPLGTKVYEGTMNAMGSKTIDVQNLPAGFYLVTVTAENEVLVNKIMIER